jgi:hypothetical protein
MARKCCGPSAPLALLSHNPRFCNASMTAFCSHPARHVSSNFPFLSVIESEGLWSSWAGHKHRHSLPMRRPLSAVAILAAVKRLDRSHSDPAPALAGDQAHSRCACRVANAEVCTENMVEIELAEWLEKDVDAQINPHWCRRSS